jgi:flagellar protein FlaG
MQSKVAPFAATPDPTYGRQAPAATKVATGTADGPAAAEEADVRLVIEEDEASGNYVYTVVNRRTGEILQRLRREQILRLGEDVDYHAGGVIRTKA